ncbi:MAG: GtrA family protein [Patescibacteria group bacterium]
MIQKIAQYVREHPFVARHVTVRQFIKFSMVGVVNTTTDFFVYFSLTRLWDFWLEQYLVAALVAFVTANIVSFVLNRRWTFRDEHARIHLQYSKFFLISLVGLTLTLFLMYVAVDRLGVWDVVAKPIIVFVVSLWNFGANKFWTFSSPALSEKG